MKFIDWLKHRLRGAPPPQDEGTVDRPPWMHLGCWEDGCADHCPQSEACPPQVPVQNLYVGVDAGGPDTTVVMEEDPVVLHRDPVDRMRLRPFTEMLEQMRGVPIPPVRIRPLSRGELFDRLLAGRTSAYNVADVETLSCPPSLVISTLKEKCSMRIKIWNLQSAEWIQQTERGYGVTVYSEDDRTTFRLGSDHYIIVLLEQADCPPWDEILNRRGQMNKDSLLAHIRLFYNKEKDGPRTQFYGTINNLSEPQLRSLLVGRHQEVPTRGMVKKGRIAFLEV